MVYGHILICRLVVILTVATVAFVNCLLLAQKSCAFSTTLYASFYIIYCMHVHLHTCRLYDSSGHFTMILVKF